MSNKLGYLRLFLLFFWSWFIYAMISSQIIPYMTHLGMSEGTRSWVFTTSALIGIISQFIFGYLSDKNQRIKIYFQLTVVLMIISSALGFASIQTPLTFYFLMIAIFLALFRLSSNLVETWSIQINDELLRNFGLIRIFGSIGWAVGSLAVANIIETQGYQALPKVIVLVGIIIGILTINISDSQKVANASTLKISHIRLLFSNVQFTLSIIIFFILFLVFNMETITVIDKMLELNSTNHQIGLLWSFQAIVEIPLMVFGFKFIQRYSAKKILMIAAIAYGIRYMLYGLALSGNQIILISGLQFISYPFLLLTQKIIVNLTTPLHLRASGHMVMTGITSNIPIVVVPLISTFLHQYMSYSIILFIAGVLCIIAAMMSLSLNIDSNAN